MRKKNSIARYVIAAAFFVMSPAGSHAQTNEPRLAFVIGNAQYRATPLATAANDAGLIAQTLTTAGFDVTGAANLDQDSLRRAFRDFLTKVQAAGPHAVTFIYLAGYGLQYAGENYFVPVDASLRRDSDIPVEAIRVSDFTQALAGLPTDGHILVLDAARANPFPTKGNPLAGGLALVDPDDGSLEAFNAAPGTVAPIETGSYGAYAQALTEMLRYGGVPLDEVFARTRLRVNETTRGAFVPWDVSKLTRPLVLLAATEQTSKMPPMQSYAALRSRPIRDFPSANEAYAAAVELDTLSAYQEFLAAYPSDPLSGRVRALLAARREALTWNRTIIANSPAAFWTYMRRYPHGPHFYDARRRLGLLSAALEPPPRFDPYDFQGLPPPPEEEYTIVDRPVVIFDDRDYAPPPPPPVEFLMAAPDDYRRLPPPPEARGEGYLPIPVPIPLPFAHPAPRQGSFSQPNLSQGTGAPQNGGQQRPAGEPSAQQPSQGQPGHPGQGQPNGEHPHPAGEPGHALPLAPQGQPGPAAPLGQPGHAGPQGQAHEGQPHEGQPHEGQPHEALPHPAGEPSHSLPQTPQGQPGLAAPQVHPTHPGPQAVTPAVEPPHAAPPVEPKAAPRPDHEHDHGAPQGEPHAAPQGQPQHAVPPVEPKALPHAEPQHVAPPAEPHVAPHVETPHVETPHVAPHAETPRVETPHVTPPAETAPRAEPRHVEPQHSEPQHAEPPHAAPRAEAPRTPAGNGAPPAHPLKPGEHPGEQR